MGAIGIANFPVVSGAGGGGAIVLRPALSAARHQMAAPFLVESTGSLRPA